MDKRSVVLFVITALISILVYDYVLTRLLNNPRVTFTSYEVPEGISLKTSKFPIIKLGNSERLFEGTIRGPECFTIKNDELFFSTHGGFVYKLITEKGSRNVKNEKVIKLGSPCDMNWDEEKTCGRPLGITFSKEGYLYIADAYRGVYKANISNYKSENVKSELLFSVEDDINGIPPKIPNSLILSQNNVIYWTDSSTVHDLFDGVFTLLCDGNGRVLSWDPVTKKNTVLMKDLLFPNGIFLSDDESFLVVAETAKSRLLKYYLQGEKKGTFEVLIDGLPGMPDNLRKDARGNIVVSLVTSFDDAFSAVKFLGPRPMLRKVLYILLDSLDYLFHKMNNIYPNKYFKRAAHWVGHFESMFIITGKQVLILIVDPVKGHVVQCFAVEDNISHISDFTEFNGYYYLGSPFNEYLARIPVPK